MADRISIKDIPKEVKIKLLEELGFASDGVYVTEKNGEKLLDRYIEEPISVDNMLIFPGSTIILDNNPLSVSSYLEEFGDVL
jgi:hypothetical protein